MAISKNVFCFIYTIILLSAWQVGYCQHVAPVAVNDSFSVVQPYKDTINVTANDSTFGGDGICITAISGSSAFRVLNCNQIVYRSDSSNFGNDTASYIICNDNAPALCDTGLLVVTVLRHFTPMMLNNSRWITYGGSDCDNGGFEDWYYYWTTDDTMVLGKIYKPLYSYSADRILNCNGGSLPPLHISGTQCVGFLRQDTANHKVYILDPGQSSEGLLYDFDLPIGDTIHSEASGTYFGDTSIIVGYSYYHSGTDLYRNTIITNYFHYIGWYASTNYWIEGIGSTAGPINNYAPLGASELICFSSNGKTYYPESESNQCSLYPVNIKEVITCQVSIHPNPTTGSCTIQLDATQENFSASVYDIMGREILTLFTNQTGSSFNFNVSALADGIYFVKAYGANGHVGVSKLVKH